MLLVFYYYLLHIYVLLEQFLGIYHAGVHVHVLLLFLRLRLQDALVQDLSLQLWLLAQQRLALPVQVVALETEEEEQESDEWMQTGRTEQEKRDRQDEGTLTRVC